MLAIVSLFNYVDRSLLSILQVPIKEELGLSDAQLGSLTGLAFALFYATAALPLARLADRWHRIRLLAAALAMWTVLTGLSGLAAGFLALLVCRIGVALGEAGSVPATHSLLADYFPLENRGTAFALWALASPVGVMIGIFGAGLLAEAVGWRGTFVIIGFSGLLIVPIVLSCREPPRGQFESRSFDNTIDSMPAAIAKLCRVRTFRLLLAGTTLHTFSYATILNWLPPFFDRVHDLTLAQVGWWTGLMVGLGGGIGAFVGGTAVDRLSRRDKRWYAWGPGSVTLLIVPLGMCLLFTGSPTTATVLGFPVLMLATCYVAPVNALAQSLVDPNMRGLTAAVLLFVPTLIGIGMGPLLTGWLSDLVQSRFGMVDQSLRYAMAAAICLSGIASASFFCMASSVRDDLRGTSSQPESTP